MNPLRLEEAVVHLDQQQCALRNLWASVMMHALVDLSGHGDVGRLEIDAERRGDHEVHDRFLRTQIRLRLKYETRAWVQAKYDGPCSFIWICSVLGMNPDAVRERVLDGKFKPVHIKHLSRIRYEDRRAARA